DTNRFQLNRQAAHQVFNRTSHNTQCRVAGTETAGRSTADKGNGTVFGYKGRTNAGNSGVAPEFAKRSLELFVGLFNKGFEGTGAACRGGYQMVNGANGGKQRLHAFGIMGIQCYQLNLATGGSTRFFHMLL